MNCSPGCNYGFVEMNPGRSTNEYGWDYGIPGFR